MNIFEKTLNEAITQLQDQEERRYNDRELCSIYGITQSSLSRWRSGESHPEACSALLRILSSLTPETRNLVFQNVKTRLEYDIPKLEEKFDQDIIQVKDCIQIKDLHLHLHDLQAGLVVLGGVSTAKKDAVLNPILRQLLQLCNQEKGKFQKLGGLVLDPNNEFLPEIIQTFRKINRPLTDIILLTPQGSNYRYNPIVPDKIYRGIPEKVMQLTQLSESELQSNNYWKDFTKGVINQVIHLMEIAEEPINCQDLLKNIQEEEKAKQLYQKAERIIEKKYLENDIDKDTYDTLKAIADTFKIRWIQLEKNTQSSVVTCVLTLIEAIQANPRLTKTFCTNSTIDFKSIFNEGKLIVFTNPEGDPRVNKLIQTCLKVDFQTWARRRSGTAAEKYDLNTIRSAIFLCDDFHQIADINFKGELNFSEITTANKIIQLLGTNRITAFQKDSENSKIEILSKCIRNWVFLKTTDQETQDVCYRLTGKFPSQFKVVTPQNSTKEPWFSQGIVHQTFTDNDANNIAVQFPIPPFNTRKEQEKQEVSDLFQSAVISQGIAKEPTEEEKDFLPEEKEVLKLIETVRKEIITQFEEILEKPNSQKRKEAKTARMFQSIITEESKTAPENFTFEQTLTWAIQSYCITLYKKIKAKLEEGKNTLTPRLTGQLKTLDLSSFKILLTNLQKIDDTPNEEDPEKPHHLS